MMLTLLQLHVSIWYERSQVTTMLNKGLKLFDQNNRLINMLMLE